MWQGIRCQCPGGSWGSALGLRSPTPWLGKVKSVAWGSTEGGGQESSLNRRTGRRPDPVKRFNTFPSLYALPAVCSTGPWPSLWPCLWETLLSCALSLGTLFPYRNKALVLRYKLSALFYRSLLETRSKKHTVSMKEKPSLIWTYWELVVRVKSLNLKILFGKWFCCYWLQLCI